MTNVDTILKDARALSPSERAELVNKLLEQSLNEAQEEEIQVGQRGLEALTQSTADEDWEPYYPDSLRRRRGHKN